MSTRTPGPWRVWTGADASVNVGNVKAEYVCLVGRYHVRCPDPDRIRADARLIAAAPDLLDALKAFRQDHEENSECYQHDVIGGDNMDVDHVDQRCALCRAADAAIATVEGRA